MPFPAGSFRALVAEHGDRWAERHAQWPTLMADQVDDDLVCAICEQILRGAGRRQSMALRATMGSPLGRVGRP